MECSAIYEIRLFGLPDPSIGPVTQFDFRIQSCCSLPSLLLSPDDAYLPSCVEGWVAGHGLSVPVRNLALHPLTLLKARIVTSDGLQVFDHSRLDKCLHPGQNFLLPLRAKQRRPLKATTFTVSIHFVPDDNPSTHVSQASCTLNLSHREHGQPYAFTYIDHNATYQRAIARSPRDTKTVVPPILALHGAGVKLSPDDEFSSAIPQQAHAWVGTLVFFFFPDLATDMHYRSFGRPEDGHGGSIGTVVHCRVPFLPSVNLQSLVMAGLLQP